jgi:hypothetical protein
MFLVLVAAVRDRLALVGIVCRLVLLLTLQIRNRLSTGVLWLLFKRSEVLPTHFAPSFPSVLVQKSVAD